jgi:DNA-binding Lrp family transcriptional regulator
MARNATLDELDRRLLRRLRHQGRESNVDLARELATSEGTVRARLKRLVDDGVIRAFTVRTAGANLKALIEIATDTSVHTSRLAGDIALFEGVEVVYEVSGDMDVIAIAEADDTEALNELIERIRNLPNVRATRSRLILKEA